ncbi:MAG: CvpA family protein [Hyphomicrobiaceae bacterium]
MSGIGPFKLLDLLLILVVAISGLVAMYRGFVREVLSILSWAAAAVAAVYVVFYQSGWSDALAAAIQSQPTEIHRTVAKFAIGAAVFLVVLIIVHLITSHISEMVLDSRVGAIDRLLGLGFGMVRGFILVVIPYMFAASFVCPRQEQGNDVSAAIKQGCGSLTWVENAASKNLIMGTGDALFRVFQNVVPSTGKITSG